MSEEYKAIVRGLYDGFNEGNLDAVVEASAPDFVNYSAPHGVPRTREGWKELLQMFRVAFPDLHFHLEHEVAEGDLVVTRFTGHGTHEGELMGVPPTGREASMSGTVILRFADGKIVERWENFDLFGLMTQLGAIPTPAEA